MKRKEQFIRAGQGLFLLEKKELKSVYARKKTRFRPWLRKKMLILEQEATTPVHGAIHGMCRDSVLKSEPDFLPIVKELNPEKYEELAARQWRLIKKEKEKRRELSKKESRTS